MWPHPCFVGKASHQCGLRVRWSPHSGHLDQRAPPEPRLPVLSPSEWTLPCLTTVNTGNGGTASVAQPSSEIRHARNWRLMRESWEPLISQHCYGCWGYRSHRTRDVLSSMTASKEVIQHLTPRHLSGENYGSKGYMHLNVLCSTIHSSQDMEAR